MKKFFSVFAMIALFSVASFAQKAEKVEVEPAEATAPAAGPEMTFDVTTIDYGEIEQNADPLRIFNFTNTGTDVLTITNAKGSCGCTVPKYPRQPILPGETATIEVRYDTKRLGKFTKTVRLTTNEVVGTRVLTIKGNVLKPATEQAVPEKPASILSPQG